jgi:hypothetical protein
MTDRLVQVFDVYSEGYEAPPAHQTVTCTGIVSAFASSGHEVIPPPPTQEVFPTGIATAFYSANHVITTQVMTVGVFPDFDTFRGGKTIMFYGPQRLYNSTDDISFQSQVLPTGWGSAVTGSGARLRSSLAGAKCSTGPESGSYVRLESGPIYEAFAATVFARPATLVSAPSTPVTLCSFEFYIDASNYASIRARQWDRVSASDILVDTVIVQQGQTITSGAYVIEPQDLELSIVRYANYVFLLVGDKQIARTSTFKQDDAGALRILVDNGSSSKPVVTTVTDVKVRSHALIGGHLLEDKLDYSEWRVVGSVPARTLLDVGFHDVVLFGQWGALSIEDGFEYTLPAGRLVGGNTRTTITSYADPVVFSEALS